MQFLELKFLDAQHDFHSLETYDFEVNTTTVVCVTRFSRTYRSIQGKNVKKFVDNGVYPLPTALCVSGSVEPRTYAVRRPPRRKKANANENDRIVEVSFDLSPQKR